MFEFEGFGSRLQALRKAKKMTQEEMADRVGVSPQAVSKWENDQSYPDITLIPTVAVILGTDINYLFGKKEEEIIMQTNFPAMYEGLPLVHSTNTTACYSDKAVESRDQTGVKFTDGSTAELSTRLAVNNGAGEIRFLDAKEAENAPRENIPQGIVSREYEFDYTENADIKVLCNTCEIIRSGDGKTRVRARGEGKFMERLVVEMKDNALHVGFKDMQGNYNSNDSNAKENKVVVELPCETGNHVSVGINGSGGLSSALNFHTGNLSINGSGNIDMQGFRECRARINGSGDINAIAAEELDIAINGSGCINWEVGQRTKASINGSGDIHMQNVTSLMLGINGSGDAIIDHCNGGGDVTCKISGSGDIEVKGGHCEKLDIDIAGSGDINATGLTARKAHIVLRDSGSVILGRVLESSTEQVKKKGKITILKRGADN